MDRALTDVVHQRVDGVHGHGDRHRRAGRDLARVWVHHHAGRQLFEEVHLQPAPEPGGVSALLLESLRSAVQPPGSK